MTNKDGTIHIISEFYEAVECWLTWENDQKEGKLISSEE